VLAGILAVGSELLGSDRLDTNSLRLTELLERFGVELVRKSVVGDDEERIAAEIVALLREVELVVVGGGLGPTADDVTREACARALGRGLREEPAILDAIERRFAAFGRVPSANNRRQARLVEGAEPLENPRGTAPGQRIELDGRTIFLLPGPPNELEIQIELHLEPWLAARAGRVGLSGRERRTLRVAMRPESEVDERLEPVYAEFGREALTLLASAGEVRIRLLAAGPEPERRARLELMARRARACLGDWVFGEGEETSLEAVVGELLAARALTIATAESCTGGLLAERLTRTAGASRYFPGGVVTYSNDLKALLVGVGEELLAEHGAVSEPVARAMAEGVRLRLGASLGVAITGVAGPEGGSEQKPVGTVHLALAGPAGAAAHRRLRLLGDRERIRWQASQAALELVRRRLAGLEEAT
jgi:nicotinamide-nucleotide amidase